MDIDIKEVTGNDIILTVDDVKGIGPIITIEGTVDPGQRFVAPTGRSPFGQEGIAPSFDIKEAYIEVTDTYKTSILLSQIIDQLINGHFYSEVIEKIEEFSQP